MLLTAVVLVNTFECITWKRDAVGEWRSRAVVLATLALLVSDSYSRWLHACGLSQILLLGLLGLLGLCGSVSWV